MAPGSFDPIHAALLSMDLQAGIVSVYAPDNDNLVVRAGTLLQHGRRAGITVIHVRVGFRPGVPEIHPRNMLLGAVKASPEHQEFFAGASGAIHAAVAPEQGDLVVTKSRVNAFAGTDLALLLRARDIDTLLLFGIATSGVVLSTALHAADADYRLLIVKDCCADLDESVHSCLIENILPRYATVLSGSERLEKGDTVSPFWGRLCATVELSDRHSSCGIRSLAKCRTSGACFAGRLAQATVTSDPE